MRLLYITMVATGLVLAACSHKQKKAKVEEPVKKEEAVTAKTDNDKSYTCKVAGDLREVTWDKTTNRCEIHYKKFCETSQVAWAESTPSICSDVFDKIRNNIEEKGFKCELKSAEVKREAANVADKKTAPTN